MKTVQRLSPYVDQKGEFVSAEELRAEALWAAVKLSGILVVFRCPDPPEDLHGEAP